MSMSSKPDVVFEPNGSVVFNSGQVLVKVHAEWQCSPRACPIHNPTAHELRGKPLFFDGRYMVRIVDHVPVIDPDDYYSKIDKEVILRNSAICALCGDMLRSRHQHDYKSCRCGEISIDGGNAYLKRSAKNLDNIIDTSIVLETQ